jgi:hypothetical protein
MDWFVKAFLEIFLGSRRDGWIVGQAIYPFLVEPFAYE